MIEQTCTKTFSPRFDVAIVNPPRIWTWPQPSPVGTNRHPACRMSCVRAPAMLRSRPGAARTRRYFGRHRPCFGAASRGGTPERLLQRDQATEGSARCLPRAISIAAACLMLSGALGLLAATEHAPPRILVRHGRDDRHRGRARLRNPTAHVRERSHPGPRCRHSTGVAHQGVGHEHGAAFLRCVLLSECADAGFSLGELSGLPRFGGGVRPLCGARPGLVLAVRPIGMPAHSCDRRMRSSWRRSQRRSRPGRAGSHSNSPTREMPMFHRTI